MFKINCVGLGTTKTTLFFRFCKIILWQAREKVIKGHLTSVVKEKAKKKKFAG